MWGKLVAAVGIGSAEVDTVLEETAVSVGSTIRGTVEVKGGNVEQEINGLVLELFTKVKRETDEGEFHESVRILGKEVSGQFTIGAEEEHSIPFELPAPLLAPVSFGSIRVPVWVATRADISMALDPRDQDAMTIEPAPVQRDVFQALESMGFRLREADVKHRPSWQTGLRFAQEFEFKPIHGNYSHLDEVEVAFLPGGDSVTLVIQKDRKAQGLMGQLAEMTGTDESWYRVDLPGGLEGPGEEAIRRTLEDVLNS